MTGSARGRYVLALDQGTTSSRAIVFDATGRPIATAQREITQHLPSPGHVEHDALEIWGSQLAVAREVIKAVGAGPADIAAIGIANQRETTIVWDRATGVPVAPAIVWQSRITAARCEALRAAGHEQRVRTLTGLPLDAYFSGPKVAHILDATPGLRARAEAGELAFGTVDSWLVWQLTGGRVHATDVSNASRTLLFDISRLEWDPWLCEVMDVPRQMLPAVVSSSGVVGETDPALFGAPIPIAGIAGDQQAATFGQVCFRPGSAKNTYGTGAFLLQNVGASTGGGHARSALDRPLASGRRLVRSPMRSKAPCSWRARPSSGCAMGCAPSTWRPMSSASRRAHHGIPASTWCPPSPGLAPRGGTQRHAG